MLASVSNSEKHSNILRNPKGIHVRDDLFAGRFVVKSGVSIAIFLGF
jgi:hypothetical protein